MPSRHVFVAPDATHGRTLCGLDVKPPDPLLSKRSWQGCPACKRLAKRLERVNAPRRKHHTDRIAEE